MWWLVPIILEASSAEAERILYYTLMSAIDAGLIKTTEDALQVLRHANQPLGPMGAEWLVRQARPVDRLDETGRNPHATDKEEGATACTVTPPKRYGGAEGARTPDPKTASLVLSQLSYSPTRSEDYRRWDGLSANAATCKRFGLVDEH